jgi:spore coat protein A
MNHFARGAGFLVAALLASALPAQAELLDAEAHPKFVNPLPIPGPLAPTMPGGTHYEVSISQFEQSLGLVDPETLTPLMTTVWGYNGSYPGATIEARRGEPITVRWTNDLVDNDGVPLPHLLPVDTSVHWAMPMDWPACGVLSSRTSTAATESGGDGLPDQWFTPGFVQKGSDWAKETFVYDNDQEAATIWYHDHALGITRLNVYAGLAGYYIIRDDWEDGLGLPSGAFEVPIAIQDRMFTDDASFLPLGRKRTTPEPSVLPEFFGDSILCERRGVACSTAAASTAA